MSLGSIAHLQYYFARTGLLDGKGAQLSRGRKSRNDSAGSEVQSPPGSTESEYAFLPIASERETGQMPYDEANADGGLVESPVEQDDDGPCWDPVMLPPTVSTYNHKPAYVPPPPDLDVLRRELREALEDARKVMEEVERTVPPGAGDDRRTTNPTEGDGDTSGNQGWYEIQGLHLLDILTLAIRAARNYYTAHEHPRRLYAIRSERKIRADLYQVLEILKRMATRNFAGGVRPAERDGMCSWIADIGDMLNVEEAQEKKEQEEREKWSWRTGEWTGKEREREWLFLKSFDPTEDEALPPWQDPANEQVLPTPFLQALQNGLRLVVLHNALLKHSRRQYEEIIVFHTDTAKPYRCADNLRYWIKAAERRWEVNLDVPVMDVVHGTDENAWKKFDQAILAWCRAVRNDLISEWDERKRASQMQPPTLRIGDESAGDAVELVGSGGFYDKS